MVEEVDGGISTDHRDRYLSTVEFAAELSRRLGRPVGRPLVTAWVARGYLPAVRAGGRWLIPESALERFGDPEAQSLETDAVLHGVKRCSICGREKPATPEHFARDAATRDGLTSACRDCRNTRNRQNYRRRVRGKKVAEAARKAHTAQEGHRMTCSTPTGAESSSQTAEELERPRRPSMGRGRPDSRIADSAARSLVALQAHAVARCRRLAPPDRGDWNNEQERAFDYACAFSDGVNAAISVLTGISPMPARLLSVAEVRRRLLKMGFDDVTLEAIERSMRDGVLGGREIAGRWYCTEDEWQAFAMPESA